MVSDIIRMAVIAADPEERNLLVSRLETVGDLELVATVAADPEGLARVAESRAQVALVGLSGGLESWEAAGQLSALRNMAVVKVVQEVDSDSFHRALRVGIRDLIPEPATRVQLAETVYRVFDALEKSWQSGEVRSANDAYPQGKVITVFSTKGGVGKTTVAVNLAVLLARAGKRTALVDLDLFAGNVALALDVVPNRSVAELAEESSRLDADLLDNYIVRHQSGVDVLAAPFNPAYAEFISAEHVERFLQVLVQNHDYVVVDTPHNLSDPVLAALHRSQSILLLGHLEIFSVKNLKTTLAILESLGMRARLRLVLNRASREIGVKVADMEKTLGLPVYHSLPSDEIAAVSSINQGTPVVQSFGKSPLTRSLQELTQKLLEEAEPGGATRGKVKAKKTRSRLTAKEA